MEFSAYPNYKNSIKNTISDDRSGFTTYRINSSGFRGEDFDNISIVTLGCSMTFGVGVHESDTWSDIISKKLNKRVANISKPGGSPDTCFRFASYWIPKLQPDIVVYLQPPPFRFEILRNNLDQRNQGQYSSNRRNYNEQEYAVYTAWIKNELNNNLNYQKNMLAIKQLCAENNSKFYFFNTLDWDINDHTAFDNHHPGPKQHYTFANQVVDKIMVDSETL